MRSQDPIPIVIIGAGIVGLATAAWLQREGRAVTLVDMGAPGEGATLGNAGCLNASSVVPMSMPGIAKQVPGWLMDPLGPLAIRWSYLPSLAPWLLRFWRAGTPMNVRMQAQALRPLIVDSVANHQVLANEAGVGHLVQRAGHLVVYSTEAGYQKDQAAMGLRAANGTQITVLEPGDLRDFDPVLGPQFVRGLFIAENGHCTNPLELAQGLARLVTARGGEIVRAKALGFESSGREVTAVLTDQGPFSGTHFVLAAGAWSRDLAAKLGDRVPLDTERGYHIMVRDPECMPRVPTTWSEGKTVATGMTTGLRFAGTVEFAGLKAPPNWARANMQLQSGQAMLPRLARSYAEDRLTRWLGFRPSMPDSLPVIGASSGFRNAFHAFGHGHIGLAAASTTGRVVADLVQGRKPSIPISAFGAGRFR